MRHALCSVLLLFVLGSCSRPDSTRIESSDTAIVAAPAEPLDTTRAPAVNAQSDTLKTVQRQRRFSSPSAEDEFKLVLRGPCLLAGEATFTITNSGGETIFREVLSAADLEASMVYEMKGNTATQAEREPFVRRRMDDFFADKNFRTPAVTAKDTYQADTIDRTTWDDLLRRPDSIGFQYLVGKEDGRRIAWSPLKQQVVRIGSVGG
ncbi:hypothetical protein SAMN00120144_0277 [Hymenobacter roseosalivarius DSM 11622]|uniref:Lipoprotein n=1 Tax=Hymenobacter roseosalivarius DSM 11622 TaxID=645990 RepID=A0A1W1VV21_9BACT|nr:hypothetical protein [Hymenobacter roseosalivarius]SMB97070.1 hypothetical protein SAMN00120144_0277 [Hymenobacter roseosalivarius DSM 11622]